MPKTIFNNIWPSQVAFNIHGRSNIGQPPLNAPNPNWQLAPGATPQLPQAAIPSAPETPIKKLFDGLPSLFSISNGGN